MVLLDLGHLVVDKDLEGHLDHLDLTLWVKETLELQDNLDLGHLLDSRVKEHLELVHSMGFKVKGHLDLVPSKALWVDLEMLQDHLEMSRALLEDLVP